MLPSIELCSLFWSYAPWWIGYAYGWDYASLLQCGLCPRMRLCLVISMESYAFHVRAMLAARKSSASFSFRQFQVNKWRQHQKQTDGKHFQSIGESLEADRPKTPRGLLSAEKLRQMHLYVLFQTMNNIHCNRIKQPKIHTAQMDMTSEMHWRRPGSADRPDQKIAVDWKVQTNASRNQTTGLQSLLYCFQKKSLVGSVDIILTSNCFAETELDLLI
jgi:hypothetical protein